jgi:hypothetical protein
MYAHLHFRKRVARVPELHGGALRLLLGLLRLLSRSAQLALCRIPLRAQLPSLPLQPAILGAFFLQARET